MTVTMNNRNSNTVHESNTVQDALDRIEAKLPLIPRQIFRLQRAAAEMSLGVTRAVWSAIFDSTERVERSARTSTRTVVGQARAEASQSADVVGDETSSLLDRATRGVQGETTDRLEDWTKAELYERAQEVDIDGRSSMSKKQLITALRDH